MTTSPNSTRLETPTRRSFLQASGTVTAASALAGVSVQPVHAGGSDEIRIALVGCGGRGTGAVANALQTADQGPIRLVAMADVFEDKLAKSFKTLQQTYSDQMDVTSDTQFLGFDGYQKAMQCLRPGDVVILATPPAFRPVHFAEAIDRGLHTFMEKPVTVDGPSSRKMLELGERSQERGIKVGVGLMCRHCDARHALLDRIHDGQIGDLLMFRSYRQQRGGGMIGPRPEDVPTDLLWQIRRFHGFMWASGGVIQDYMIHNIDECCWMKGSWPVSAQGGGGRLYRDDEIDQNFDNYEIEYTFADGSRMFVQTRNVPGCKQEFASYVHGTKGSAVISSNAHSPARCRIYTGQVFERDQMAWRFPSREPSPYQLEWDYLIQAIRSDRPFHEVKRGVEASVVTAMGRMAAHTGQRVSFEQMLNHEHDFAPTVGQLTYESPAPLQFGPDGTYPQPQPGRLGDREFGFA